MSPMCPDIQASRPSARQKVFFTSAPTANAGGDSKGRDRGSGAWPRERRIGASRPATARVTESSQGTWMGRSWASQASARSASRTRASSSSVTIGSPARLPLVITSRSVPGVSPGSPSNRCWSGA